MIFKRRAAHKLPKFPASVEPTFKSFCEALPAEAVSDVRKELDKAVKKILKKSLNNDLIETKLVNQLYEVSCKLLETYTDYSQNDRALIIGAIRYFVVEDDPLPDNGFSSGYYDDAKVMNYVLSKIGAEEMILSV